MVAPGVDTVEVGIVESDDKCRQFMTAIIGGTPGLRTLCACATGKDALWCFAQNRPRLCLVSLFLRDMTGTEFIHRTRALWPGVLPILLVPDDWPHLLIEALESGARGYLQRPCLADEMVRAIWTVHQGGTVVWSSMANAIVDYFRARGDVLNLLTERERQVLRCLSRGLCQQAITLELGIDKATVRTHVRNMLAKLDVHSAAEAVAFYLNPRLSAAAKERPLPVEAEPPARLPGGRVYPILAQVRKSAGQLSSAVPSPLGRG
jgi:DNA-binding NarL/FixJ family response regulator